MRCHRVVAALSLTLVTGGGLAQAQAPASTASPSADAAIEQLRKDARQDKRDIIAGNMSFTAGEATAFWELYKGYEQAQKAVGDQKVALIKAYAASYSAMTDAKAAELIGQLQAVEDKAAATKRQFIKSLEGVLPAKKVARYYQVDNRIQLLVDLDLASQIPLVK